MAAVHSGSTREPKRMIARRKQQDEPEQLRLTTSIEPLRG